MDSGESRIPYSVAYGRGWFLEALENVNPAAMQDLETNCLPAFRYFAGAEVDLRVIDDVKLGSGFVCINRNADEHTMGFVMPSWVLSSPSWGEPAGSLFELLSSSPNQAGKDVAVQISRWCETYNLTDGWLKDSVVATLLEFITHPDKRLAFRLAEPFRIVAGSFPLKPLEINLKYKIPIPDSLDVIEKNFRQDFEEKLGALLVTLRAQYEAIGFDPETPRNGVWGYRAELLARYQTLPESADKAARWLAETTGTEGVSGVHIYTVVQQFGDAIGLTVRTGKRGTGGKEKTKV